MRIRERFNPRAPCGARPYSRYPVGPNSFISTHAPLAGRDADLQDIFILLPYFNPRAPCGARPIIFRVSSLRFYFNPRAPCGARQSKSWNAVHDYYIFQPTRPLRGATVKKLERRTRLLHISTHAPLAGRDKTTQRLLNWTQNFNPRAPCGARPCAPSTPAGTMYFNPRAPCGARLLSQPQLFGLHHHFNPRAPCGARRYSRF